MLKALVLAKNIEDRRAELEELQAKDAAFAEREKSLTADIQTAQTKEEREAVEAAAAAYDAEIAAHEAAKASIAGDIEAMEAELAELEKTPPAPAQAGAEHHNERMNTAMIPATLDIRAMPMNKRVFDALPLDRRQAIVAQADVKTFLANVRAYKGVQTSVSGADLLIPEILLDLISENRFRYSKLLNRVRRRYISGKGKQPVSGTVPPAVWTGRCKRLNRLRFVFNAVELEDFKNAGVVVVCNSDLEDNDINLAAFLVEAISESLGMSDDMAILYGKGPAYAMPTGVMTRLNQTTKPEGYPDDAPEWVDLHETNLITIDGDSLTGAEFWFALNTASGNTFTRYSRGELSWAMNSKTYNYIKGKAIATSVTGEWVALIGGTLPIVSGQIDVLEFMPDYDIIGGYFDLYLWGQRSGITIGMDDMGLENRINDTTVFFGKERADGLPVIAGGFVGINIRNTAPITSILFPSDDANTLAGLLLPATATVAAGSQLALKAIPVPFGVGADVTYTSGTPANATVDAATGVVAGVKAGTSVITATSGGFTATCTVTVTGG